MSDGEPIVAKAAKVPSGRGPGRPRKDAVPKSPGDTPARGVGPVPNLEKSLVELLEGFNLVPQGLAAVGRLPKDDPLSDDEIRQLAHALDTQARRSPAFGRWLTKFVEGGESLGLLFVVASIAGKRVVNHLPPNVLSMENAQAVKGMLKVDFLKDLISREPSAIPPTDGTLPPPPAEELLIGLEHIEPVPIPEV
jgi:hypothetical protein